MKNYIHTKLDHELEHFCTREILKGYDYTIISLLDHKSNLL